MKILTRADELLMVSIACLGSEAYSSSIISEVSRRGGKRLTAGSLWVSLDQLAERGLVRKRSDTNESRHGGRPRVYYRLSPRGVRMLLRMQEYQRTIWKDVPDLSKYDESVS